MRILIDGTKLFFASKKCLKPGMLLNYRRLAELSKKERIFFTSYNPLNTGQESFLGMLRDLDYKIMTYPPADNDEVVNFDADLAFLLGRLNEPCLLFSNSKYLLPFVKRTNSTLGWFSDDLPAIALLDIYRDNAINFIDLHHYTTMRHEQKTN